jgi:aspartate/methionine/tyrosine aminotransferase
MGTFLDSVPTSGIIRVRDLMFSVEKPFRLDQGDMSFDAPDSLKSAMKAAIDANHTHYLQTAGLPRLQQLLAEKLRTKNGIPVSDPDEVMMSNGGVHALYLACQALVEPGDEVIVPDPVWPQMYASLVAAHATPVPARLLESSGWRYDFDEFASRITPRTRGIYLNSPHNPTGGVLTREDLERVAALAHAHDLWVIADEAYEDVVFDATAHVSLASLPGMHDRTVSVFTFSKTYAVTGLRIGYVVSNQPAVKKRILKLLGLTTNNVSSIVQYGAIGALEGSQAVIEAYRQELQARRDLFYRGLAESAGTVFSGDPPLGAFYAFPRIDPAWRGPAGSASSSRSWAMVELLISRARVGCVPGVDFGANGEDHVRFCFARGRAELEGALQSMRDALRG